MSRAPCTDAGEIGVTSSYGTHGAEYRTEIESFARIRKAEQALLEKLKALPPERRAEVEDFVDFLKAREERTRDEAAKRSYGAAGNGPRHFIVERKDGLIAEYGDVGDGVSGDALVESGLRDDRFWHGVGLLSHIGNADSIRSAPEAASR